MTLPDIRTAPGLSGKRVLLRTMCNVPLANGAVADDFRLKRALPTIQFLRDSGVKVILVGHLGREGTESLVPVHTYFQTHFPVSLLGAVVGEEIENTVSQMKDGEVVMLENVRREKGETANDETFARRLASLGDVFVNDSFPDSHREHASIVGLPRLLPSYAGIAFQEEVGHLKTALHHVTPSLCIIGGAKFETKEPLIRKFLKLYDRVFVGGALANDFFKAKGFEIGGSLSSDLHHPIADLVGHDRLLIPRDVVIKEGEKSTVVSAEAVPAHGEIVDAGPETLAELLPLVSAARYILWSGPLGQYENGFGAATTELAGAVALSSARSVVGGGDTVASIAQAGLLDKFSFVSTAGGAMLQFLVEETLPGIGALERASRL